MFRTIESDRLVARYEGGISDLADPAGPLTEQEIALVIERHLRDDGWDTFPEVDLKHFGGRPDLIATRSKVCQVIECKTSLTFGLVEQALRWHHEVQFEAVGMPHLIVLCVGRKKNNARALNYAGWLMSKVITEYRLGVMAVYKEPQKVYGAGTEHEVVIPVIYCLYLEAEPYIQHGSRRTAHMLIEQLNPDCRIATPGSRGGKTIYMTDFKRTTIKMARLMTDGQPRTLKMIVTELANHGGHHYSSDSSAVSSLRSFMSKLGYSSTNDGRSDVFTIPKQSALDYLRRHGANVAIGGMEQS